MQNSGWLLSSQFNLEDFDLINCLGESNEIDWRTRVRARERESKAVETSSEWRFDRFQWFPGEMFKQHTFRMITSQMTKRRREKEKCSLINEHNLLVQWKWNPSLIIAIRFDINDLELINMQFSSFFIEDKFSSGSSHFAVLIVVWSRPPLFNRRCVQMISGRRWGFRKNAIFVVVTWFGSEKKGTVMRLLVEPDRFDRIRSGRNDSQERISTSSEERFAKGIFIFISLNERTNERKRKNDVNWTRAPSPKKTEANT